MKEKILIATTAQLQGISYLRIAVELNRRQTSAIVFSWKGKYRAYINHCMHMQRPLDCQEDTVFDKDGKLLRCSMHGFVFDPESGECLSPVCSDQRLQSLKLQETDGNIYCLEKRLKLISTDGEQ
jgi:nitrite reductase/ring-hydroxylating ferredoxin subunit